VLAALAPCEGSEEGGAEATPVRAVGRLVWGRGREWVCVFVVRGEWGVGGETLKWQGKEKM
jgi:hypothetical protein